MPATRFLAKPYKTLVEAIQSFKAKPSTAFCFVRPDGSEREFSWNGLYEEIISRAAQLKAAGLHKGERLLLVLPEGEDFVPTFFGALWAGIVPVPVYPPMSLGKLNSYVETLAAIMAGAKPKYVCTPKKLESLLWPALARSPSIQGVLSAEMLRAPPAEPMEKPENILPEDICFLQFTSGSTAVPKGVVLSHANLLANCKAIMVDSLHCRKGDVAVSWLPLYHDMGLIGFVISTAVYEVPSVLFPTTSFIRNPGLWLELIHRKRGTLSFAPNFAYALLHKRLRPEALQRFDLSCMRVFGCGSEPINPHTLRAFVSKLAPTKLAPKAMLPCYGMAEHSLAISFVGKDEEVRTDIIDKASYESKQLASPPADGAETLEFVNCGKAFPGHEMAIFNAQGKRLEERHIGEVWLKGPSVACGYFENPQATEATFGGGWLRTGDLGYLAGGEIYITGRCKDLVIIHGRNYDPQRLEWALDELEEIRQGNVVAFSRPGPHSEELVVVAESRSLDKEKLAAQVSQHLNAEFQLACADVVIVPPGTLPKTSSGKLQRQKTRERYLKGSLLAAQAPQPPPEALPQTPWERSLALLYKANAYSLKAAKHALEIRSLADAKQKLKQARDHAFERAAHWLSRK
ncbi:MAG: fatty acyl-AMP ligase [Cystobacterineae bacterium]|nr:fatty acyl-AMP ligase [Cystobacterineae bacterium]